LKKLDFLGIANLIPPSGVMTSVAAANGAHSRKRENDEDIKPDVMYGKVQRGKILGNM
jgi:hypothetical protein